MDGLPITQTRPSTRSPRLDVLACSPIGIWCGKALAKGDPIHSPMAPEENRSYNVIEQLRLGSQRVGRLRPVGLPMSPELKHLRSVAWQAPQFVQR